MGITLPNERIIVFGLGMALAILAGVALMGEIFNQPPQGASDTDRLALIAQDQYRPGVSTTSQLAFLYDCRQAMTSLLGRAQPSAIRGDVSQTCRNRALEITAQAPTFSVAWLTAAVAAVQSRDWPGFADFIEKSYRTGANEQWVAELRVDLVSDLRDRLDPDMLAAHRADLAMLLSHDSGRQFLVERYVALEPFRTEIDAILPNLPESASRRFLNLAERREIQRMRQMDAQLQ